MWYVHTDSNISFFLLLALTCALGTGIADIVLYKTMDGCDNGDPLGLNIHQYIYGRGIANIVMPGLIFLCITRFLSDTLTVQYLNRANNLLLTYGLFWLAWTIIGGIILFRSNIDCINSKDTLVIYTLVVWCASFLPFLLNTNIYIKYNKSIVVDNTNRV